MNYDKIRICLEQKNIFMENIVNYSKQLEVKAQQDEVDFGDVLDKRQEAMTRIDKCQALIKAEIAAMFAQAKETNSPIDEIEKLENLLSHKKAASELAGEPDSEPDSELPSELAQLEKLMMIYDGFLARAMELDKAANDITRAHQEEIKNKLSKLRPANKNRRLYQ